MSVRANRSVALNILSFVLQEVSFFVCFEGTSKKRKEKREKNSHALRRFPTKKETRENGRQNDTIEL
jgi:hypothetical protein